MFYNTLDTFSYETLYILFYDHRFASCFSCTDGLDLYPNDKVTVDNYWNTAEDALRAVNATYSNTFPQSDTYGCDLLFLDAASDNTYPQHSNQFGNFQQIALNAFEANHAALQELWNRRYVTIRRCADFLVNIGNVNMDPILKIAIRQRSCFNVRMLIIT